MKLKAVLLPLSWGAKSVVMAKSLWVVERATDPSMGGGIEWDDQHDQVRWSRLDGGADVVGMVTILFCGYDDIEHGRMMMVMAMATVTLVKLGLWGDKGASAKRHHDEIGENARTLAL